MSVHESAFATISGILNEAANSFDVLRIIAGEDNRLTPSDREAMRMAANDLEAAQRALCVVHLQLIETRQQLIATNEQLIEARKTSKPNWKFSMSTGWMEAQVSK